MSENLTNLFNDAKEPEATANARSLAGTAQLTNTATQLAAEALKTIEGDFETYKDKVAASKADHSAMDALLAEVIKYDAVDVEFLKELSTDETDKMLKSQQSKRSRAKGKVMTMDNYRTMMIGAISENLIRVATGQSKNSSGPRRLAGHVDYTAEQLEELAVDQEKLRREIRNVQSKKSIMKSKEGFSEEDDRWTALLKAEEQLKGLRTETTRTVRVDVTKNRLTELLAAVADINSMKPAAAKKLLEEIKQLTAEEDVAAASEEISEETPDDNESKLLPMNHVPDAHAQ